MTTLEQKIAIFMGTQLLKNLRLQDQVEALNQRIIDLEKVAVRVAPQPAVTATTKQPPSNE